MRIVTVLVTAVALAAGFAAPAPPVAAHPLPHGGGTMIVNLDPAPGEVVPRGPVTVGALASSGSEITDHRLEVNGVALAATRGGTDPTHPVVSAVTTLEPGNYVARLEVHDAEGRTTARAWRFAVGPVDRARLFGPGRVETAVAISQDLYPTGGSARAAMLARADEFADALAGVPAAAAVDGPLLLANPRGLPEPTAAELSRLLPAGATVYLLGGRGALGDEVAAAVEARGFRAERLAGESRYDTAAAAAALATNLATVFVASGETFPDALAASSPAARDGHPILLTPRARLHDAVRRYFGPDRAAQVRSVFVVGGTAAVSDEVVAELRGLLPAAEVHRLSGASRFDTAAAVAAQFFATAPTVALASGERFPDALAGGRHAAARGAPLLLASSLALPGVHAQQVAAWRSSRLLVYGGLSAVSRGVGADVVRARLDGGGPGITQVSPAGPAELHTLDQITIGFDQAIALDHTVVYVSLGGNEVGGTLQPGEFDDSLVFTATQLPAGVVPGQLYEIRVTAAIADSDGLNFSHVDVRLPYRKLDLSRGDSGALVRELQERLRAAGYWLGTPDGTYGSLTHQAVMAFQKVHGISPDGVYNRATRERLESAPERPQPRSTSGRWMEIDLARQVLMIVTNGRADWTFNTSTGHGRSYQFQGSTFRATTSTGQRRITRQIDGMREAERGLLWRPKYFDDNRGIAVHGSTSVPSHPASAGCVRLTYAAMDFIWNEGLAPLGTSVWVYPENHYG